MTETRRNERNFLRGNLGDFMKIIACLFFILNLGSVLHATDNALGNSIKRTSIFNDRIKLDVIAPIKVKLGQPVLVTVRLTNIGAKSIQVRRGNGVSELGIRLMSPGTIPWPHHGAMPPPDLTSLGKEEFGYDSLSEKTGNDPQLQNNLATAYESLEPGKSKVWQIDLNKYFIFKLYNEVRASFTVEAGVFISVDRVDIQFE